MKEVKRQYEEMEIEILPDGNIFVPFFPTSFSDFVIKNLYSKVEQERYEQFKSAIEGIFCG